MSAEKHLIAFATIVILGVLGPASTTWAQSGGYDYENYGGNVKPCSLDGVNPAYHPEIFGSPAAAREFGFALSRDGIWHTQNCPGARDQAVTETSESASQGGPHHHSRSTPGKSSRTVAKRE
jgi:hypothetical protein